MSGPSGFLGRRVVDEVMEMHRLRREHGLNPGTLILLSASPGRLMERLTPKYLAHEQKIPNLKASRVDYFTQHAVDEWIDHLGSIGAGGSNSCFINLAAVAGPIPGKPDAMYAVNYKAPTAAAMACKVPPPPTLNPCPCPSSSPRPSPNPNPTFVYLHFKGPRVWPLHPILYPGHCHGTGRPSPLLSLQSHGRFCAEPHGSPVCDHMLPRPALLQD